jgi:hypothetical protein
MLRGLNICSVGSTRLTFALPLSIHFDYSRVLGFNQGLKYTGVVYALERGHLCIFDEGVTRDSY